MKFKAQTLVFAALILSAVFFSIRPLESTQQSNPKTESLQPAAQIAAAPGRTVAYKWYDFFDVPQDPWVWQVRYDTYGFDTLISATYPVVYIWNPYPVKDWYYHYTSARINVTARELNEITMDDPEFVPYNLLGNMPGGLQGGNVQIKNWYLRYINESRATELVNKYTQQSFIDSPFNDGYITELTGDIVMNRTATMKVLGITEATYNNIESWWTSNNVTVQQEWTNWLLDEANVRLIIYPFFQYSLVDHSENYIPEPIKLSYNSGLDQVTLTIDFLTGGMECLLARWFKETLMPGYEYYYNDMTLNAVIGSTTTNVDLDMEALWTAYMWSYNDTAFGDPIWAFEPVWGDRPDLANKWNHNSPAYPYYTSNPAYPKEYFMLSPGNGAYNDTGDFDYCPAAWDLKTGETLTYDWSNVYEKGPLWVYKQLPFGGPPDKPILNLQNITGQIKLSETAEPYPLWDMSAYPNQVKYDIEKQTLTYTGPINMTDLSFNNVNAEWLELYDPDHPNGLLPYGEPYIEFKMVQHDVAVASITPSNTRPVQGELVTVDVKVRNLGIFPETFTVTAKYDSTIIGSPQQVTSLAAGGMTTLTFNLDTTGFTPGVDYTLSAEASTVPSENDVADNTFVGSTVKVPAEHDVAIASVSAAPTTVSPGQNVTVTVVASNEGYTIETFNVTTYYNSTIIGTKTVTSLTPAANETLTFQWNTTGLPLGTQYVIKAQASVVSGETVTANNEKEFSWVRIPALHDVEISSVTAVPNPVTIGQNVTISVKAENDGMSTETFDVTVYYGDSSLPTKTVTDLAPSDSVTLTFRWNTSGVALGSYEIKAVASTVPGETDTGDNTFIDGVVQVKAQVVRDIAITEITVSADSVNVGDTLTIHVKVKNKGTETESFSVRAYGNTTTLIGTEDVEGLASGAEQTLEFSWDTTDVLKGKYFIRAIATTVTDETSTLDNTFTGPMVTLNEPEQPGILGLPIEIIAALAIVIIIIIAVAIYLLMRK